VPSQNKLSYSHHVQSKSHESDIVKKNVVIVPASTPHPSVPPEVAPVLSWGPEGGAVESGSVGELGMDEPAGGTVVRGLVGVLVRDGSVGGAVSNVSVVVLVRDGSVGGTVASVSVGEVGVEVEGNDDETGGEVRVGR
jgi:hypothetical protein